MITNNSTLAYKPVPLPKSYSPGLETSDINARIGDGQAAPTPPATPLITNTADHETSTNGHVGSGRIVDDAMPMPAYNNQNYWLVQEAEHRRQTATRQQSSNNAANVLQVTAHLSSLHHFS